MTDYYSPASWEGVAEKDGFVVVVDTGRGSSILKRSGGYETTAQVPAGDCPRCGGTGQEPDGWTLEQANASPREFNLDAARREGSNAIPLLPDVVSPLHFDSSGRQKCIACHGKGQTRTTTTIRKEWPTFTHNPQAKVWHVERHGVILSSGVGLGPCADYDRERSRAAVEQIVDRIERAMADHVSTPEATTGTTPHSNGVAVERNLERNGIEVTFPTKPDETVRAGMKRLGFRWSGRQGLWYARYSTSLWDRVHQFLKLDDAGAWRAPEPVPLTPGPAGSDVAGPDDILSTTDIYGRPARISRRDYDLGRTQIRLYCQTTDTLLTDLPPSHPARQAQGGATTIHRDNVATVDRAGTPRSIDMAGVTWYADENDAPQTFWWHRDDQGRLWQAILTSGTTAWWGSVETKQGICNLTTASECATHREEDVLYGRADAAGVNPPLQLLAAMGELIRSGADLHALPRRRVNHQTEAEPLEQDPAQMTRDEILAEALRVDAVIRGSDQGFPAEVAERMEALRAAMYRLDPSVDLDAELRERRAYDVPKLVRDWKDLTRRLERGHGIRSNTRAAATTKSAHLGNLAQSRDQILETLRIAVRQARERGEPIPLAIRAEPELARILAGKPDPQTPATSDSLDIDGTTWRLEPTPDGRPVWATEGKGRRRWSVTRFQGSGTLAGKSWWTVQTEVDGRPVPLNTKVEGAGEGPLYALTDDEEPSPPTGLLHATSELIRLDYPNDVTPDDVAWRCALQGNGTIRYEARRDPWWCFYLEGRPGRWEAHWYKPGDIGTHRCLTQEEHGELEGGQDPLAILVALTGYIRHRGGPPPRIEVRHAEIVPREDGGWDYAPLDGQDVQAPTPAGLPVSKPALSPATPAQPALFAI